MANHDKMNGSQISQFKKHNLHKYHHLDVQLIHMHLSNKHFITSD